jgi:hypothetical protein
MRATAVVLLTAALLVIGCHNKDNIPVAPAPLRPEPAAEVEAKRATRTDCDVVDANAEGAPMAFDERSIDEAQDMADEGVSKLKEAEAGDTAQQRRDGLVTEAVYKFINALGADPYNVRATYNLAAAYARIGRKQCSVNLLTRLIQMRKHSSRKVEVEKSIDRLLGRGTASLDPDFNDMRNDERFRTMIRNMCDGTSDPACVRGH